MSVYLVRPRIARPSLRCAAGAAHAIQFKRNQLRYLAMVVHLLPPSISLLHGVVSSHPAVLNSPINNSTFP